MCDDEGSEIETVNDEGGVTVPAVSPLLVLEV